MEEGYGTLRRLRRNDKSSAAYRSQRLLASCIQSQTLPTRATLLLSKQWKDYKAGFANDDNIEEDEKDFNVDNLNSHAELDIPNPSHTLVVDLGTGIIRAGFANDDIPCTTMLNAICANKNDPDSPLIGDNIISKEANLDQVNFPFTIDPRAMGSQLKIDWDATEKVLDHVLSKTIPGFTADGFTSCKLSQPILITEPPWPVRPFRERMAEEVFERYEAPAMYMGSAAQLSMFAAGRLDGVAVGCGHYYSYAVPFSEGYQLDNAGIVQTLGHADCTTQLASTLEKQYMMHRRALRKPSGKELLRRFCDRSLFVASDASQADDWLTQMYRTMGNTVLAADSTTVDRSCSVGQREFALPDGTHLSIDKTHRAVAGEVLFQPSYCGKDLCLGMHQLVKKAVTGIDISTQRRQCWRNIVLSGGTTKTHGFVTRLTQELRKSVPITTRVKVHAPPDRELQAWIGGAIIASLPQFVDLCVSKAEYEEQGTRVVSQKLFGLSSVEDYA